MVAGASPSPSLRTVTDRLKDAPVCGLASFTAGVPNARSGFGGGAVASTLTEVEQLFVVSDSSATVSTHAP